MREGEETHREWRRRGGARGGGEGKEPQCAIALKPRDDSKKRFGERDLPMRKKGVSVGTDRGRRSVREKAARKWGGLTMGGDGNWTEVL